MRIWWVLFGVVACGDGVRPVEPDSGNDDLVDAGTACRGSCDAGAMDAGRPVDAGRPTGGSTTTLRPDGGPTLCDLDAGVRVRVDPSTTDGGFNACPPAGTRPIGGDCAVYCACWFRNCGARPAYGCVLSSWQVCLEACATFTPGELECRLYRVNNNPLERHCAEARPRNTCP